MQIPRDLIGIEAELSDVARAILALTRSFDVSVVGGYHVTCSDETEWECARAFQRIVVTPLLTPLKVNVPVAVHTMNLGARYESGAALIAEHHYAIGQSDSRAKVMIAKINSHVSVENTPEGLSFGKLNRYGNVSTCCGALSAIFTDAALPALDELRQTFQHGGFDRLAMLADKSRIQPEQRALFAAVVNARLQAARAADEVAGAQPHSPTVWLIFPCVTINRRDGDDTELLVGQYTVDATEEEPTVLYHGLGDVPVNYRLDSEDDQIAIADDRWPE